jgi:hypothetical protein
MIISKGRTLYDGKSTFMGVTWRKKIRAENEALDPNGRFMPVHQCASAMFAVFYNIYH